MDWFNQKKEKEEERENYINSVSNYFYNYII